MKSAKYINLIYVLIGVLVVLLYGLPYYILGENAYIRPYDFLDSTIAHLNCIIKSGNYFSFDGTIPLMYGLPRMTIPYTHPFEIKSLFFLLLPTYWAIVSNMLFAKICSFVGMYLLLIEHNFIERKWVALFSSLLFCLLPFCTDYGISSAGIPLVIYAVLNIRKRKHIAIGLLLLVFYALYSSLVLSGIFICILLGIVLLVLWIKEKKLDYHLVAALFLMVVIYFVANWNIINRFLFDDGYVSQRSQFSRSMAISLEEWARIVFVSVFIKPRGTEIGNFYPVAIVLPFIYVYLKYRGIDKSLKYYLIVCVCLLSLTFIGYWCFYYDSTFNFGRLDYFYPTFFFIMFAKAVELLSNREKIAACVCSLVVLVSICVATIRSEYSHEYPKNIEMIFKGNSGDEPVFSQYYDVPVFNKITDDLKLPRDYSVKVVSYLLPPAIAEYNGFYCLDGYTQDYSIEYKKKMRDVIAPAFDANAQSINTKWANHFDYTSNYLYVYDFCKYTWWLPGRKSIKGGDVLINSDALKSLACDYLFSAVEILNKEELNLEYKGRYSTDESFYNVYVYKL